MDPKQYHFKLPPNPPPLNTSLPEVYYPNIKAYWNKSTLKRNVNPIEGITTIVIHATAGSTSSGAIGEMKKGKVSFHWLIPDENEKEHGNIIWACAPESLAAKHVRNSKSHPDVNNGKNLINHYSLGIEIVNTQINDPFSDWQIKITADIIKHCWAKYPNLVDVVSHAKLDPDRRTDPGKDFPWTYFKGLVLDNNFEHLLTYNEFMTSE